MPHQGNDRDRRGDLVFIVVVVAAYISIFTAPAESFTLPEVVVLIALGIVYSIIGTYGFASCERAGSLSAAAVYFAIQIPLSAAIMYLSRAAGFGAMLTMPLAAHSVAALPRRWMLVTCALLVAAFLTSIALLAGWEIALTRASITYLAGIVFTVVFVQIAVSEGKARAEVERLAAELSEANRKLREYAAQVEELATTQERNRLAREIHDGLGHYLTAINMQIQAARAVLESDRARSLDALGKAQTLTQEALADVRRSVAALRAPPTEDRPLRDAIAALADECRAAGIHTEFVVTGAPRPLSAQTELTLYRAAQEGLTNVRKHAHATRADLTLDYRANARIRLVIRDGGIGCGESGGGFGLLGLRERAQLLGGEVRTRTAAGQGFTLEVEVPG